MMLPAAAATRGQWRGDGGCDGDGDDNGDGGGGWRIGGCGGG